MTKKDAANVYGKSLELLEEHLPEVWKNGDVRVINSHLYNKIKRDLYDYYQSWGFPVGHIRPADHIEVAGVFGTIYIKEGTK